jgi:hypothetical protein
LHELDDTNEELFVLVDNYLAQPEAKPEPVGFVREDVFQEFMDRAKDKSKPTTCRFWNIQGDNGIIPKETKL